MHNGNKANNTSSNRSVKSNPPRHWPAHGPKELSTTSEQYVPSMLSVFNSIETAEVAMQSYAKLE